MTKDDLLKLIYRLFFIALCLVVLGGLVVFALVLVGTIMGGEGGSALISMAQAKVVPIYEWIMGVSVIVGVISLYISKTHAYKMESKKDKAVAK